MPALLSDPPLLPLVLLGVAALIAGGLWLRYRKWPLLAAAAVLVVLLLAWVVVGLVNESPREEAVRRVKSMAEAVTEKNWAKFSEHVSDGFAAGRMKKADLKGPFDEAGRYGARAAVWNFELTDPPVYTETEVVIRFDAVAEGQGQKGAYHFQATFGKDPDGRFRMRGFQPFDYVQKNQPATFPGY